MLKKHSPKNSPRDKNTVFDILPHERSGWNRPKETVYLRRHFYRKYPVTTAITALVLVLGSVFTADTFLGHANTVHWYPKNCLGGWTNPGNAAGAPDLSPNASASDFTANNSAVLDDSVSQMFCGDFGGDIPESSVPISAILNISWTFKTEAEPVVDNIPASAETENQIQEVPGVSTTITEATSTPATPEITPEPQPEPTPTPPPETPPAEEPPADTGPQPEPDVPPADQPSSEPEPATSLFNWIQTVFAQENTTTTEDVSTSSEDVIETPEATPTTSTPETGTSTETTSTPTEEPPVIPADNDILEVRYSINGETWQTLGTVTDFNWQNAQFPIPLAAWEDLKKLQISLVSFPVAEAAPVVYLDGMSIAVDYETRPPIAGFDFDIQNVVINVNENKEAKIDASVLEVDLPEGAAELQFFAVPSECFGDLNYIKAKVVTKPYCGDPIGFPVFPREDYLWKLDRPVRIAIGACRSQEVECDDKPEHFIFGFVSEETLSADLPAGRYTLSILRGEFEVQQSTTTESVTVEQTPANDPPISP